MKLLPTLLFVVLSCSSLATAEDVEPAPGVDAKPPDILFINVDDWGQADVGFQGSLFYETPRMDALAERGMVFTRAYAGAANCAPSRACLLTGQNTPRHGIYTVGSSARGKARHRKLVPIENRTTLPNEAVTIAEELRRVGYHTVSIGKWHLGKDPRDQGFDVNIAGSQRGHPPTYFSPYRNPALPDGPPGEYLTDRLTAEAVRILRAIRDKPLFLYLPFFTVHGPLQCKKELIEKYRDKPAAGGQSHPVYAAMVEALDVSVGRLVDAIEAAGHAKSTLIVLTSDNGGIRAVSTQDPLRAGKGSYYEGGVRVPLAIVWPGRIEAGSRCGVPVSNLDFYPTLLDIAGAAPTAGKVLDGRSLLPLLEGRDKLEPRKLYWHFPVYLQAYSKQLDDGRDALFRTRPGATVLDGNWKLHEYFEDGALELYDLSVDPGERRNLAAEKPEKAAELHRALLDWRQRTGAPIPNRRNPKYREN